MRYRLNFKGFYDTPEELFGCSVNEALTNVDFGDIENMLAECINNIKTKLSINLNLGSIDSIQFANLADFAAHLMITEQNQYTLIVHPNKIVDEDALESTIYHELCHMYQLNKLFTDGIMFYNSEDRRVEPSKEEYNDLLRAHLNDNNGHTLYWQELADKINTIIKPAKKITAYLTEYVENIRPEPLEEEYFNLSFNNISEDDI
jgi:hypothetical protein